MRNPKKSNSMQIIVEYVDELIEKDCIAQALVWYLSYLKKRVIHTGEYIEVINSFKMDSDAGAGITEWEYNCALIDEDTKHWRNDNEDAPPGYHHYFNDAVFREIYHRHKTGEISIHA